MVTLEEDIKELQESTEILQNQVWLGILNNKKRNYAWLLDLKAQGPLIMSRFQT